MKLIALPDVHGRSREVELLADRLAEVDLVILAGDLSNGKSHQAARVVDAIRAHNEHILAVPGNMDAGEVLAYMDGQGINLHRQSRVIDGVNFVGMGGALPFAGDFVFEDPVFERFFAELSFDTALPQVLICHQPPFGTPTDHLPNIGHVGSKAVRAYVEKIQPLICFTGHIHEAAVITQVGQTQIINPGPLWLSGQYAYAEIENGKLDRLEIVEI